jgi:hypothetical protein
MKRFVATAAAVIALLAVPSVALAGGSSTCSSYNPQLCQVVSPTQSSTNVPVDTNVTPVSATQAADAGSLPFTGLDIGLVAVGGVVLIGAGLVARRLSAER